MQRDVEKVEEIYELFRRRDLPAIFAWFASDVEVTQSSELPWGGHYSGHDGLRQFLAKLTEHLDSQVEIERLIDAGDQVVAIGRTSGKVQATGLEFEVPVVHVWQFRDGQVIRLQPYLDNATLLAALEM